MARIVDPIGLHRKRKLSCADASELIGCSTRHFLRLRDAYEAEGAEGLIDGRRGRASGRRAPVGEIEWVFEAFRTRYVDFNALHCHERIRGAAHAGRPGARPARDRPHPVLLAAGDVTARGRIGRMNGTLQGRLPALLREAGIGDIAAADTWLESVFRPAFNARFAVPAREAGSAFIAAPAPVLDILCEQHESRVDSANTVTFGKLRLQIPEHRHRRHFVRARVRVHVYPDGALATSTTGRDGWLTMTPPAASCPLTRNVFWPPEPAPQPKPSARLPPASGRRADDKPERADIDTRYAIRHFHLLSTGMVEAWTSPAALAMRAPAHPRRRNSSAGRAPHS